ncbi:unnamed protein product [Vitrella brassicaformis CCMP3155]|uniref:Uncharacterized protein n=2 Tax=Vitrella brassicaformis TaxID=1169539 RepID=A0A0G4EAG8_VITBC|nr:unnamed protein product [Vitrella brassicaformis CCMP3155]|mmetsp:Transcript_3493/g.7933  ORF Transcript_3493/g.7933 Transcript_3493/m.7933 type:complete len:348 (+) Transcript_3493:57-1100(+)|eukprot:CEL92248.1 unnamed protein product [Vitrella brassicaformis CCMP3155]
MSMRSVLAEFRSLSHRIFPRWREHMVSRADLAHMKMDALRWGFVEQDRVRQLLSQLNSKLLERQKAQRAEGREVSDDELTDEQNQALTDMGITAEELKEGMKTAYECVAQLYVDATSPDPAVRAAARQRFGEILTPSLKHFLMEVLDTYAKHQLKPYLVVEEVHPRVLDVRVEKGSGESELGILGRMDQREALYHFFSGVLGPEGALSRDIQHPSGVPRRIVVDVELAAREKFRLLPEQPPTPKDDDMPPLAYVGPAPRHSKVPWHPADMQGVSEPPSPETPREEQREPEGPPPWSSAGLESTPSQTVLWLWTFERSLLRNDDERGGGGASSASWKVRNINEAIRPY